MSIELTDGNVKIAFLIPIHRVWYSIPSAASHDLEDSPFLSLSLSIFLSLSLSLSIFLYLKIVVLPYLT